ncbi:phospholipase-like protein [Tanacetum coccineum]
MSQLAHLTNSTNSVLVKDMMVKLFEVDNKRDFRIVRESYAMCQALNVRCEERREQMIKMQNFLHVSTVLAESYNLLKELQVYELEKCKELMKSISETQLKERLPVILEGVKVFDKKGINQSDYCIRFKLADSVPKQGGIFGDCGVWVCIFLYCLSHGLSLDVEDPVDVALTYREKMSETTQTVFALKLPILKIGEYDLWSMRMEQYLTFIDHALWKEAIKNRFGGNKESKKMQKTILKQNYENFAASRSEGLDKTYDRFQKLISQLEIHGEVIS